MSDIAQIAAITGLGAAESGILLEAANGDPSVAVQLHFDQEDSANHGGRGSGGASSSDDAGGAGSSSAAAPPLGREPGAAARAEALGAPVAPATGFFGLLSFIGGLPGFRQLKLLMVGLGQLLHRTGLASLILPVADLLFLTPLRLLGVLDSGPVATGAVAVQRFAARFEAEYGATHPFLFKGSCSDALTRARRDAKFVLVYVHDEAAPHTADVCRALLSSLLFSAFVDESFIFWVPIQLKKTAVSFKKILFLRFKNKMGRVRSSLWSSSRHTWSRASSVDGPH